MNCLITRYRDEMWGLFASSSTFDVTPDYLIDGFIVVYSDNGSNDRTKEESIVYSWSEYISECKG